MITNDKSILVLLFFSLLFMIPFGKAQDNLRKKDKEAVAPFASKTYWLYIKKRDKDFKRMIKSNAMLEYFSRKDSIQTFAEYHTCNKKGMYVSKFGIVEDSILINKEENIYKHRRYSKQDTIISFVAFEDVYQLGFRNYHEERRDANILIGTAGLSSVGSILGVNLFDDGDFSLDRFSISAIVSGVAMIGYSTWRIIRIRRMKMRSMDKFELIVV